MSVKCTHTYSKMSSIHRHWIADAQHIFSYQKGGSGEERTIHSHIKSVLDLETFHFLLNPLVPPQTWLMIGFLQRLNTRPLVAGLCTHEARSDQQPDRHTQTHRQTHKRQHSTQQRSKISSRAAFQYLSSLKTYATLRDQTFSCWQADEALRKVH